MLNVLVLDQLEHEVQRMEMVNTILDAASSALGPGCIEAIHGAIGRERGMEYRRVESVVVRPSEDIGQIAIVGLPWPLIGLAFAHRRAGTIQVGSAMTLALGVYWFASRAFP